MPTYEYLCEGCEIIWEKDADIGKAPKTTKCKECGKRIERYLSEITFSFRDDGMGCTSNPGARDFHTIKKRYEKFNQKGYDKTAAHTFYRRSIRETKDRILDENARYKSVNVHLDKMAQDGLLKNVGEKKATERQESSRRFSEAAYKKAGLDYTKKPKQST